MDLNELRTRIINSEGYRQNPYRDHLGNWTVGYGTLIKGWPLSKPNVGDLLDYLTDKENHRLWLDQAIAQAQHAAEHYAHVVWGTLTPLRKMVLTEMAYQLGATGLADFIKTREFVNAQQFNRAAAEMLDSRWAEQTPERARRLAEDMRRG